MQKQEIEQVSKLAFPDEMVKFFDQVKNLEDDALLTTEQLAAWMGCTTRTLESARRLGTGIPYVKLGRHHVRYRLGTVRKYFADKERTVIQGDGKGNGQGGQTAVQH